MLLTRENGNAGRKTCPVARGQPMTWLHEPGFPKFKVAKSTLHPQYGSFHTNISPHRRKHTLLNRSAYS